MYTRGQDSRYKRGTKGPIETRAELSFTITVPTTNIKTIVKERDYKKIGRLGEGPSELEG